jgi:hypothetical protein
MTWDGRSGRVVLRYDAVGVEAVIATKPKKTHVVFELVGISPEEKVEVILWGPYPTTINRTIGETVGIVRDKTFAIGIMSLNPKTIGGYPRNEADTIHIYYADDSNEYDNVWGSKVKNQRFWGETARRTDFGAILQAYCRNRSRMRIIANWGHEKYQAPPYADGGVIGSSIALYGCPAAMGLETIGKIEVAEGLPHPVIDGEWMKTSRSASLSYFVMQYGQHNIDKAIALTKRAGLQVLYIGDPFADWGQFNLKKDLFPKNWDSMREFAEKAREQGVSLGFHTLSNFIKPHDAYVTPVPDKRLARVGVASLMTNLDKSISSAGRRQ